MLNVDLSLTHKPYLDFLEKLKNNELSDIEMLSEDFDCEYIQRSTQNSFFFDAYQKAGYYAILTKTLIDNLSKLLEGKKCLEVMAGRGALAYHLNQSGVNVIATDNNSWRVNDREVIQMNGLDSVKEFYSQVDILIMSWPPMRNDAFEIIQAWGTEKPIIVCGEQYGCCANENFWEHFESERLEVDHISFRGIYDEFYMGYFKP